METRNGIEWETRGEGGGRRAKNHGQARQRERAETRRNRDDAAGVHFSLLLTTERFQK